MRTFKEDYAQGIKSENDTLEDLKSIDITLKHTKEKSNPFDFVNDSSTVYVELKTRNLSRQTFPTTAVSESKVLIAKSNPAITYYFAFKFDNGLYYIKYNQKLFDTFEAKLWGRHDRGKAELNDYVFIPVGLLTKL